MRKIFYPDGIPTTSPAAVLSAVSQVDGAGSGLDADTIDGKDSTDFLEKGTTGNVTAGYTTDLEILASDTITPDLTAELLKKRTLTGNVTINFPTGGNGVCHILLVVDASDRTVTLAANVKAVGTIPTLTAGLTYLVTVLCDSGANTLVQIQEVSV